MDPYSLIDPPHAPFGARCDDQERRLARGLCDKCEHTVEAVCRVQREPESGITDATSTIDRRRICERRMRGLNVVARSVTGDVSFQEKS